MGFMDEYYKALEDNKQKSNTNSSGGSGGGGSGGGSSPKYVGTGHESFYKKTFDAPVSKKVTSSYKKKKKEEEEKKKKRKVFTKGAFEDGYDIGDVTKTILGTAGDVVTGAVKGLSGGLEGIVDLGAYGVAGVLDAAGNDDSADRLREKATISQTDMLFGGLERTADKYSVLGDKADAVIDPITQALGYIGMMYATAGLGAVAGVTGAGATALSTGTMFASSMGGSMGEAYEGGATDDEALKHGVMKGAVDAGSELIFGGLGKAVKALGFSRGLSSLDDIFAKKLSSKISNQFWKNAVEYGVKASAEGVEEVLAGLGSAVSKKLTYMSDKELNELIKDENLMEQFIVGTVASGIMQSGYVPGTTEGSLKEANKTGRDFISGLSQNEQKVVDKLYQDEIASREKNGKVTQKEKDKIYDSILKDMERGYISTDTIEEVLGGESYSAYRDTVDSEDAILQEYEELGEKPNATPKDYARYTELTQKIKDIHSNSQRNALRAKLNEEVMGLVKGDRLIESYNERTRRGQAFEADLTKYDAKQQATIQKAIDSGILNNTNRTHEFVDIISKISADKGVLFDFTNNAKLKESGFAIEGKQVNGFVTKDGISINIDSPKAWQSTVGHEVTHVLEGTELYTELQNTLFEYAKSKGEYDSRMEALTELYKDIQDADLNAELTADLVGEYLFTDENFIKNLSTQNRNVFQKIYDEIKYLLKVATGSKEAKELERIKRAFDKAYKEAGTTPNETKYSLTEAFTDSNGTQFDNAVLLDTDFFDGTPPRKWGDKLRTMVNERASDNPFILPIVDENGNTTILQFAKPTDRVKKDGGANHRVLDELSSTSDNISKLAVVHIDEIVSVSEENSPYYSNEHNHQWLDQNGWLHRNANVINQKNGSIYNLTVDIAKAADGRTILYATDGKIKKVGNVDVNSLKIKGSRQNSNFDTKVAQEDGNVKTPINEVTENGLTMTYVRVPNQNTPNFGSTYGQNIEPAGEYMSMDTMQGKNKIDGYEYGTIQFKKPLVLEHINTGATGWKKTVSDMYGGLTGKKLTKALIKDGYDAIVTYDDYGYSEIVNLNGKKLNNGDARHSLSNNGEQFGKTGQFATPATELRYDAPAAEESSATVAKNATTQTVSKTENVAPVTADDMSALFPNDAVPVQEELDQLLTERNELYGALEIAVDRGSAAEVGKLAEEYEAINSRIKALESEDAQRVESLTDAHPEMDAPFYGEGESVTVDDPFEERDWYKVGNQKVNAYMYENPEVKPFFQAEAQNLLGELSDTQKGERWYNDELYYSSGGEKGFGGQKRFTSDSIATLLDDWGMSYADIEKGLNAIIEDNGAENIAAAKKIEFMLNERLLNGYKDFYTNGRIEPDQGYINLLEEKQITEYRSEAFDSLMANADLYAPTMEEYYAPMLNSDPRYEKTAPGYDLPGGQQTYIPTKTTYDAMPSDAAAAIFDSKDPKAPRGQTSLFAPEKSKTSGRVAKVLTKESKTKEKSGIGMKAVSSFVDKGMVFENLSLDSGNQEVQAKWNSALPANTEKKAQYFMENGADGVKPLKDIIKDVKKTGKEEAFYDYMYHVHNIDRMSLEDRFGLENKAVFGDTITAEVSTKKVQQYEKANPEFKTIAESVYAYNKYLRGLLVENGVISQETADLWEKEYPHYVPVRRVDQEGKNITVPLDTNKTGVNAPVKRATGGSSDIEPLFNTMAMRTEQVFSAIARNSFGIELKNTLNSTIDTQKNATGVDEAINLIEDQESNLLKPGTLHNNPTFTVFENGERVEFEITEDMYDALKPAGKLLGHRSDKITKVSEWRRNMLTTWNPVFALWRNPVKDLQDVMINSQHAAKTYAQLITPTKDNVIYQIATHGKWAAEYESNGGKGSTYFDGKNKEFKVEDNAFKKAIGFPLRAIENAGEFIEEIPRLAEYIASRKEGRSVDRSMLDAARVTTNFAAGGDVTKFANAHGFTFLNASVQGASQHVRNFREATRQDGMKGFVKTLAKYTLAGIPGIILNNMIWDDDEEYEELSDYVKQNYYVVAKTEDGKFIRIPKGRTATVMQNALEQMQHLVTGDGEADFGTFYELFMNNIAPNNPIENNILAPVMQVKNNRAWYGEDLVPSRLQDLPAAEQFDESTDALSKFIGEKTGTSPYKWNYLIDQYSGGLGDMILPMMTPEAESGDNTLVGNLLAPWKKEMTTDSVLNNKNPGNFYDLKDKLDVVANGKDATEEDKMKSLYLESVGWDMGDLYAQKREIQSSDLPDDHKYEKVREIQAQINELANNALDKYNNVSIDGAYSEVGDRRYNYDADKDKWYEIQATNSDGSDNWYYVQEQLSHDKLGMSYSDFWNGKAPTAENQTYYGEYNGKRYNYDADKSQWYEIRATNDDGSDNWYYQKEQEVTKGLGISYEEYWSKPKEYNFAYDKPGKYAVAQAVGGYDSYMVHYDALENWQSDNYIGADKDSNGNSISGSRKKKVLDYINGLDLDYGEKIILYRTVYTSKADKRAYNQDIIDYLNERDDISYQQMKTILEELDFKVDDKGYIKW